MKTKVTKKEIRENYKNIISIGYCNAQNLLKGLEEGATYYSLGVYGWSCDYYEIDNNTIISTGYNPIGNINNYDLIKKYELKAQKIMDNFSYDDLKSYDDNYFKRQKKLKKLLDKFIFEILESEEV